MPVGNASAGMAAAAAAIPIAVCAYWTSTIRFVTWNWMTKVLAHAAFELCIIQERKRKKKMNHRTQYAACVVLPHDVGGAAVRQTTKTHRDNSVEWIIMHFRLLCALASERHCICVHTSLNRNGWLHANGDSFVRQRTNNQPIYQTNETNETKKKINFN